MSVVSDEALLAALLELGPAVGTAELDTQRRRARDTVTRWCKARAAEQPSEKRETWHDAIFQVVSSLANTPIALKKPTAAGAAAFVRSCLQRAAIDSWRRLNPEAARELRAKKRDERDANRRHISVEAVASERAARQAAAEAVVPRNEPLRATLSDVDVAAGRRGYETLVAPRLSADDRDVIGRIVSGGGAAKAVADLVSEGAQLAAAQKRCQRARERLLTTIRLCRDEAQLDADDTEELLAFAASLRDRAEPRSVAAGSAALRDGLLPRLAEDARTCIVALDECVKQGRPVPWAPAAEQVRRMDAIGRCRRLVSTADLNGRQGVVDAHLRRLHKAVEAAGRAGQ